VRAKLCLTLREPITESAYRDRQAEARAEMIPLDECAMLYTEYHHEWDDADCERDEDEERRPTDAAFHDFIGAGRRSRPRLASHTTCVPTKR
jgi:hypothetical protein